jgi:protein BUR2
MENQWLFTRDEVVSSPSIIDGISPVEERVRRAKGVNFIYQAGILLELPQTTLYVAGVFFHRFYMRYSMDEKLGIHHYNIAATALFLANKTEENCTKTKNIIIAVAKVAQKNAKLIIDEQSKEYWRWRDSILMYEEVMLEALTFDLIVHHPYSQLYKMLERIACIHNKRLRHAAWAFCSDACLTALPLVMESRDIAIASLFFSSNFTGERIEDVDGMPWYEALEGNTDRIIQAINILHEFYKENPLRKPDNPYQGSPEFSLEATRKNGEGSSTNATPRTDHHMQSPGPKANGTGEGTNDVTMKDRDAVEAAAAEEASQTAPGDSDAVLKEAANIPATHTSTQNTNSENGDGLLSPASKRKAHESLPDEIQDQKRPRTGSDADEGEVRE